LQDFPDKGTLDVFRNNAQMSSMESPKFRLSWAVVLPVVPICIMSEAIIVEGTGSIFLAGSYLVKAAIGETIDNETLGELLHIAKSPGD
jgi:acetyl-CoA carboxylase carboxyltransferase component